MMKIVKIIFAAIAIFFGLWSLFESYLISVFGQSKAEDCHEAPFQFFKIVITYVSIILLFVLK